MLDTKNYLEVINDSLPRGSRKKISLQIGKSAELVGKVLRGKRKDYWEIVRLAENLVLTDSSTPIADYMNIGIEIMKQRGASNPKEALCQEILKFIL